MARDVLPKLQPEQISRLFRAMPLTPRVVLVARMWATSVETLDRELLTFVHRDKLLCQYFWAGLDAGTKARLNSVIEDPEAVAPDVREAHKVHSDGNATASAAEQPTAA